MEELQGRGVGTMLLEKWQSERAVGDSAFCFLSFLKIGELISLPHHHPNRPPPNLSPLSSALEA